MLVWNRYFLLILHGYFLTNFTLPSFLSNASGARVEKCKPVTQAVVGRYYYKNAKLIVKVYRVSETMSSELRPTHVTVETLHPLRQRGEDKTWTPGP